MVQDLNLASKNGILNITLDMENGYKNSVE